MYNWFRNANSTIWKYFSGWINLIYSIPIDIAWIALIVEMSVSKTSSESFKIYSMTFQNFIKYFLILLQIFGKVITRHIMEHLVNNFFFQSPTPHPAPRGKTSWISLRGVCHANNLSRGGGSYWQNNIWSFPWAKLIPLKGELNNIF